MIQVRRIGHAMFETPDLPRLIDYHTSVTGLALVGARCGSRVLRRAHRPTGRRAAPRRGRRDAPSSASRSRPTRISPTWRAGSRRLGVKSEMRSDSAPGFGKVLAFEDPKGTAIELFKEWQSIGRDQRRHRHRRAQARPYRVLRRRSQGDLGFLRARARLQGVGLDRRLLRVHALQRRPPHGELHHRPARHHAPRRVRAARLLASADRLRPVRPEGHQDRLGSGAARPRPQRCGVSPAIPTITWSRCMPSSIR